jgi:stage V sporulation protein G
MEGNSMEITSITIRKMGSEGKMKAIVSVTFDNAFVVHDIKVIEGTNGYFIAMPSRKTQDGEFKDIVHPINSEFREKLSGEVLKKYREALESAEVAQQQEAAQQQLENSEQQAQRQEKTEE